jgi:hypothetical protein
VKHIKTRLINTFNLLALLSLAACGGGGSSVGTIVGGAGGGANPSQVALVDVSTTGSTSIDVSWLPVTDSTTPAGSMSYQVYASTNPAFTPDKSTLKATVTGVAYAHLTGLLPATQYAIIVVAVDAIGNNSASLPSSITTSTHDNQLIPGVAVTIPSAIQVASVSGNSVTLAAGITAPQVGSFITSTYGGGFLRQVTSVTTVSGQTVIQTQPAALNQIAQTIETSSVISLVSVPSGAIPIQAGVVTAPAVSAGATELQWPQSNFKLSSAPAKRNQSAAQAALQAGLAGGAGNIDVSAKTFSKVGSWSTFTGPDTVGVLTGTSGAVNTTVNLTNTAYSLLGIGRPIPLLPAGTPIPLTICKVAVVNNGGAPGLVSVGGMTGASNVTQAININASGIAARPAPYVVTLRAYIDTTSNQCAGYLIDKLWPETLDIPMNVVVVSTPNFPKAESQALDFNGGFTVHNDVTFTFDPILEADVKMSSLNVDYARLETKSRAALTQTFTVTASGAATIDDTKELINPARSFVKVYMVGSVPVVMSGDFTVGLHIAGSVDGALTASEQVNFSLEDIDYGMIYQNNAWQVIPPKARPAYSLVVSGKGDAKAHLTVELLPRLNIKFYDAATGRLVIKPYLTADAGVHGEVFASMGSAGTMTGADAWITQGLIAGGVDAFVMADLTIWKQTWAKWPSTANIADYTTYTPVTIRANTPIVGIPTLNGTLDTVTINPADINAFLIKGRAVDVPNPFLATFGGPASFLAFAQWTDPSVVLLNTGYTFVPAPNGSDPGDVWVKFDAPGTYKVRLGGYSAMGALARQVVDVDVVLTDNNGNGVIDQLENRLFVVAPANPQVTAGATVQLTLNDPLGNPLTKPNLQWVSASTSVATVDAAGLVTGVAAGTANITVTDPVSGAKAATTVTVTAASACVGGGNYVTQGGLTWTPDNCGQGATIAALYPIAQNPTYHYFTWPEADAYCTGGNFNGQTGWRLPTQTELSALYASGALNGQGWALLYTWSSTPYSAGSHYIVVLNFGSVYAYNDTYSSDVTCVR